MSVPALPFGTPLDSYRRCNREGCAWMVPSGLLCRDHGGLARVPGVEFRTDPHGRAEYRAQALATIRPERGT